MPTGHAAHRCKHAGDPYIAGMAHHLVAARLRRPAPVFVCRKCLKRVANGGALKRALKSELKSSSAGRDVKSPRVVMTGCFGICPKRAVVLASATTLARGEYLLLSDSADAAVAAQRLMPAAT